MTIANDRPPLSAKLTRLKWRMKRAKEDADEAQMIYQALKSAVNEEEQRILGKRSRRSSEGRK